MALCSRCLAIPFNSLPRLPAFWDITGQTFRTHELPQVQSYYYNVETSQRQIGYPWHPELSSLAASAPGCALCGVIYQGFQRWRDTFEAARAEIRRTLNRLPYNDEIPEGQVLYLTQRPEGVPGLNILVRVPPKLEFFYVLPGVAFSVDEDNSMADLIKLRPVDANSGSGHSLSATKSFLTTCRNQHEDCNADSSDVLLPSRVLDLGFSDDLIQLVEPRAQHGTYACLSYCWGKTEGFTTTRQTIDIRRSGFAVTDLPATLRDAVKVVRYLGVRYLWIDSLCICQDDSEDWTRESAQMTEIYANAHLVLAADHAADQHVGLFSNHASRPSCRVDLPGYAQDVHVQLLNINDQVETEDWALASEPLSERGWAFQERVLSRRILHYGSRQLYYECRDGVVGEDGCHMQGRMHRAGVLHMEPDYVREDLSGYEPQWADLLAAYGARKLTYATDKLPAIGGLAKLFAEKMKVDYLAGIWSHKVIDGISWWPNDPSTTLVEVPGQYIAPSWSWASYSASAYTDYWSRKEHVAEVLEWKVELKSEANPFGEVVGGWIRLRAPLVSLIPWDFRKEKVSEWERRGILEHKRWFRTPYATNGNKHEFEPDFDVYRQPGIWESLDLKLMVLSRVEYDDSEDGRQVYYGLTLANVGDSDPHQMKRIGRLQLETEEGEKICQDMTNRRTITLI
ncbi:heterokaryon incompatibility protein-domain-containing protein [Pestalotiopsis sp. NC0098]|nr:heterokaryon incompatibility protein-domain-containing protein [Pestalotiopsis sp. NC0098]